MPDYILQCSQCGQQFSRYSFYALTDEEKTCPRCGSTLAEELSVRVLEMEDLNQYGFC